MFSRVYLLLRKKLLVVQKAINYTVGLLGMVRKEARACCKPHSEGHFQYTCSHLSLIPNNKLLIGGYSLLFHYCTWICSDGTFQTVEHL